MKKKGILALLLSMLLVFSLSACSGGNPEAEAALEGKTFYCNGSCIFCNYFRVRRIGQNQETLFLCFQCCFQSCQSVYRLCTFCRLTEFEFDGFTAAFFDGIFRNANTIIIHIHLQNDLAITTIIFAESLGGVETLVTYPITQTHATTPEALKKRLGIDEKLIRLSVGTENVSDIIFDLECALGKNL